jgi:hypothetical protein
MGKLLIVFMSLALGVFSPPVCADEATGADATEGIGDTGTDPRDFAPKFMPYYRYTELENNLEQQEVVLFGLLDFSPNFAMTYEIPLAIERDVSDTILKNDDGTCGPGSGRPGEGLPPISFSGDCDKAGIGDTNLRFMYRTSWDFLGGDWLIQSEMWFPTATDERLGSEQFQLAPGFTYVRDIGAWPAPGAFFALMNFYQFDVFGDDNRDDVSMYKGRWFFMLPLHPSGIYALPEFQPIYDFEENEFSFWVGPEIGKMLAPGRIAYIKPGFSFDPDEENGDRKFTLELGFRYFF